MKRTSRLIMLLVAALIVAALSLFFFRDRFTQLSSAPEQPPPEVLAWNRIAEWIPASAPIRIVVDVPKVLAIPQVTEKLRTFSDASADLVTEFLGALLTHQQIIEQLALVGGSSAAPFLNPNSFALIVQGHFDTKIIIPAVRTLMATSNSPLTPVAVGLFEAHCEAAPASETETSSAPDAAPEPAAAPEERFCIAALDREHFVVGTLAGLVAHFGQPSTPAATALPPPPPGLLLFGSATLPSSFRQALPEGLRAIDKIAIEGKGVGTIAGLVECSNEAAAEAILQLVEGLRMLMILEQSDQPSLAELLRALTFAREGSIVRIELPWEEIVPLMGTLQEPATE